MIPVKAQIDIRLRVIRRYLPKLILMYTAVETDRRARRELDELRASVRELEALCRSRLKGYAN